MFRNDSDTQKKIDNEAGLAPCFSSIKGLLKMSAIKYRNEFESSSFTHMILMTAKVNILGPQFIWGSGGVRNSERTL